MSLSFRRSFARRLLQIAALAAPAVAPSLMSGCGVGSGKDCGDPVGPAFQLCFDPTDADAGIRRPDGGTQATGCPTRNDPALTEDLYETAEAANRELHFFDITAGPESVGKLCCYTVQNKVDCTGRPYLVDDVAVTARPHRGERGWCDDTSLAPLVDDLTTEARTALAKAWTRDGLFEHASIASFGRFALELLAVGAPAELVARAHEAALDEVRHARLCLGLASAYAGAPVGPSGFPFKNRVEVTHDLAALAANTACEGCIGETVAALQAREQLARATDPAVRAALEIIAEDEARHAELAWSTVVWAIQTGGDEVRNAVAEVFAGLEVVEETAGPFPGALESHGRLHPAEERRLAARAIVEVVRPAARLLLTGGSAVDAAA